MHRVKPALFVFLCLCLAAGQALAAGSAPRGAALGEGFSEGFEDITQLASQGWVEINNSEPLGDTDWEQGLSEEFPAHSGPSNSFISANFNNTAGVGTISNWLLTPEVELRNGTLIQFWTRRVDQPFPDRLEVRLSTSGSSTDVGTSALSVGDFDTTLLSINPDLADAYPVVWTRYSIRLGDLPPGTTGRIAFRYFVTEAGPDGINGNYIGIDTFSVDQPLFSDRFESTGL